jgi:hypothetical protein
MRVSVLTWTAATLVGVLPLPNAYADGYCSSACKLPNQCLAGLGSDAVCINAQTGEVNPSPAVFGRNAKLTVLFHNKNPFAFQYRYSSSMRQIEDAIIAEGLKKLLGFDIADLGKEAKKAEEEAQENAGKTLQQGKTTAPKVSECPEIIEETAKAIQIRATQLKQANDRAKAIEMGVKDFQDPAGVLFTVPADPALEFRCSDLCASMEKAEAAALKVTALNGFDEQLEALNKAQSSLGDALQNNSGRATCQGAYVSARQTLEDLGASIQLLKKQNSELATVKESIGQRVKVIADVKASGSVFVDKFVIGPVEEATEVQYKISKTLRATGATDTVDANTPIRLGRSRFSISAGLGVSFLDEKKFGRQPSSINGAVVDTVGITGSTDARFGIVAQLNGLLWQWNTEAPSIGWALGAAVTGDSNGTDFGFYTGPTFGFISDKLLLTFAYHLTKQDKLAGGFKVGDVIPDDLEGDVPTTEETTGALLVTVTYKVR